MTAPIVFQRSRASRTLFGPVDGDYNAPLYEDGQLWERVAESALGGSVRPVQPQTPTPTPERVSEGLNGPETLTFESTTERNNT